jgi:hypothetical protein
VQPLQVAAAVKGIVPDGSEGIGQHHFLHIRPNKKLLAQRHHRLTVDGFRNFQHRVLRDLSVILVHLDAAGSWLMFIFSLIAIACGCGITLYAFGKDDSLMSKFYGFPVFKIGIRYTALQLGLSLVIYIIGAFINMPYWVGLLLSLVLAGAAGIGVIAADNAHDVIRQIDHQEAAVMLHPQGKGIGASHSN